MQIAVPQGRFPIGIRDMRTGSLDWLCGKNGDPGRPKSSLGKWDGLVRPASGEEMPPTKKSHLERHSFERIMVEK